MISYRSARILDQDTQNRLSDLCSEVTTGIADKCCRVNQVGIIIYIYILAAVPALHAG